MSDIGQLVDDLIAAGCAPGVAARVVAEAFAAGNASTPWRNSTGNPVDTAAEKRRAYDRERKRKIRGIPPDSTGNPPDTENRPISLEFKREEKKIRRGSQIPPEYRPGERAWKSAVAEVGEAAAERELVKFKNHAVSKGRIAKDWDAAFSNWVMQAVDYRQAKGGQPSAAALSPSQKTLSWEEAFSILERTGKWSAAAPVKDLIQAPPGILQQYGYSPDGRKLTGARG